MPKSDFKINHGRMAALLAGLTIILLVATAPAVGLTWDEPSYMGSAESYAHWVGVLVRHPTQAFSAQTIDAYWTSGREHPPLDKLWSGLVWEAARHFFDDLTAHRLGNMILAGWLAGLVYLIVAETYGRTAGLFGAAALLAMPRVFFYAHLAALDLPVAVAIFAVTYLFWRVVDRPEWWWAVVLGVAWGLAEAFKLNATFLPAALGAWLVIFRRKWITLPKLALIGVSAPLTFLLVWPWLYHGTFSRILGYIKFHVNHNPIGAWYFGQYDLPPPWHYALVMTWAVMPLTLILLAFAGMARAGRGQRDGGLGWLLLISALVPMLPFIIGHSIVYDGERLFLPAFPFLAALAGLGFGWLADGVRGLAERWRRPTWAGAMAVGCAAVLLAPPAMATVSLYPHLLSYYSEGVGGLPGAVKMGLDATYWVETYAEAIPFLNAHAKRGDRIWVEPFSYDIFIYYQMHGRLNAGLVILNDAPSKSLLGPDAPQPVMGTFRTADWYVVENRRAQYGEFPEEVALRDFLATRKPVNELSYQGVPLLRVYQK
jgi:4-amino-4-deoxy-L-arabinose transferase-like glycosyltransferase